MKVLARGGWIMLAALIAALSPPAIAGRFTDREHTRIEEPRPPDVPNDAELESAGAVIGRIEIDTRNIFDEHDERENSGIYRLADHLHFRTKPAAIRAQLLFKSGERYRARKLAEAERNLRMLLYIYDARVFPVHYADGKVDVRVITKDVWTLSPSVSFGRSGGTNSTNYGLQDSNFLGWGKDLEFTRSTTVDRTSNTLAYTDPNVFLSRWTAALLFADSSDGHQRSVQVAQPFYSLDTTWSAKLLGNNYDRTVSRYYLGNIVDQFNDNESTYEVSGGVSGGSYEGWTKRLLFGMHYDRNIFVPTPGTSMPAKPLPPDRVLSYPFVGFDIVEDKFAKAGDQNQIGKAEDLYFGTEVTGQVGYSNEVYGGETNALLAAVTAVHGIELPRQQQLFLKGDFSTRLEAGRVSNLISDAGAKYYWRWRPDWLLYVALSGTVTDSLDPDQQLLLGGDSGMRGYPLRYESGTSRGLLTVEQRVFTDWYPYRLVRVGAAAFADVGRTWGSGVVGSSYPGLLSDVGLGLRVGNTRSGLGNVLHVDLAFPLSHTDGIQRFQILVQTFQSF
ncbi:MAG TPA: BamA/TamA family outer membrane protein [Pseudomonadota bacterium]|nr:BamA/TamA family outer membrane protein [Pseudomonadota bacterium]